MARFCIYRLRGRQEYIIDLQADLHRELKTRIAAPLMAADQAKKIISRLSPRFTIGGQPYFAALQLMAAVPVSEIDELVADVSERADELTASIDFVFQGF